MPFSGVLTKDEEKHIGGIIIIIIFHTHVLTESESMVTDVRSGIEFWI